MQDEAVAHHVAGRSRDLVIGLIFTIVSLIRSYLLRRAFEGLRRVG